MDTLRVVSAHPDGTRLSEKRSPTAGLGFYDTAGPLAPSGTPVATAGADRVLFGTDWPAASADVITGCTVPAVETHRAFTDRQRRGIDRDNALRLMPALRRALR